MSDLSRRDALSILAGAALSAAAAAPRDGAAEEGSEHAHKRFRLRTLTAGTSLQALTDLHAIEAALDFLATAKTRFEDAGYGVQTTRSALNPWLAGLSSSGRMAALADLHKLDAMLGARGALLPWGPATRSYAPPRSCRSRLELLI